MWNAVSSFFFFFCEFHFPSPASLSCWIYEMLSNAKKGIPHSGLWETDFKYRLCCGSLFKLFFSLMSSLINKTARHPATCEVLCVFFPFVRIEYFWTWFIFFLSFAQTADLNQQNKLYKWPYVAEVMRQNMKRTTSWMWWFFLGLTGDSLKRKSSMAEDRMIILG